MIYRERRYLSGEDDAYRGWFIFLWARTPQGVHTLIGIERDQEPPK